MQRTLRAWVSDDVPPAIGESSVLEKSRTAEKGNPVRFGRI
jgi:hypothetical protein